MFIRLQRCLALAVIRIKISTVMEWQRNACGIPKSMTPSCEGCHVGGKTKAPKFDPEIKPHKRHKKGTELHCNACHVRSSMTCYNCHFSEFMKTKNRKGNFIPTSDLFMLVNYQGKVTAATAVVCVHDKKTFVSYTPYFTHNVMKKGRIL